MSMLRSLTGRQAKLPAIGSDRSRSVGGPRIGRRDLLLAAASSVFLSACDVASAEEPGLKQLAASKGLLYGSLIRYGSPSTKAAYVMSDPAYARMMERECSLYVSITMFWKLVAPTPERTNLSPVDPVLAWAQAHGMGFRGTPLVWQSQTPSWFGELPDRTAAVKAMQERVRVTCARFAGKIQSWDVVNEPILTKGGAEGLRKNVFFKKIGPEYIDIAFQTAREADPKALLTLNDNSLEYSTATHRDRRRALLALVDGLQKRKVPIDAIGIQTHLATEYADRLDENSLAAFLKEISDRGLKIMITEMDVIDRSAPSDLAARDAEVASLYKRFLDVALANRSLIAVITWGLSDRESWITRGDQAAFRRKDGLPARPLPFDENYRPKKAYYAIADALRAAPGR